MTRDETAGPWWTLPPATAGRLAQIPQVPTDLIALMLNEPERG